MLQKNQGRCPQEIEVYQKEHGEKLNQKVSDKIDKADATSRRGSDDSSLKTSMRINQKLSRL
jgi:hypothetical protein